MNTSCFDNLVIFEMANNHMGDVEHGKRIIHEFAQVAHEFPQFRCAIKFQYRNLDTFIHPDFQNRLDIKYIKRFTETRLTDEQFITLKKEAEANGLLTLCTPFDEISVGKVVEQGFSFLKVASCSFNDWPLLECISNTKLPIIISTAGASLEEIDRVVSFLTHRDISFCLMHCVGAYPTPDNQLEMNQIDFFRQRYEGIPVGFSTHEEPGNMVPVTIAVAKGAVILERHVGVPTEKYSLNAYSSTPDQIRNWLQAAVNARSICGVSGQRRSISEKEQNDLRGLQRGVFFRKAMKAGEKIRQEDLFFAIPNQATQMTANNLSKYLRMTLKKDCVPNEALLAENVEIIDDRDKVLEIIQKLTQLIRNSGIHLQDKLDLELSHHYGIENFYETGCAIITCVNREYCKKILLVLPGQTNPTHTHHVKEETFHVLYGDLILTLNGVEKVYNAGDLIVVERGTPHKFTSQNGAVLEEISTTHYKSDSYYDDSNILPAEFRKTYMTFYQDWLSQDIK